MIGFTALNSWDMVVSEADLIVFKFGDAKLFDFNHKLPQSLHQLQRWPWPSEG